jgi:lysophospholipase L1-like esterase
MVRNIIAENCSVKIIGDSLAAGAGSSMSYKTEEIIFEDDNIKYFKRIAPNSWWGLLEKYLKNNYNCCAVSNNGCGGAYSYQINKYLDKLILAEDQLVLVLIGLNDRKLNNGMIELMTNCQEIIDKLICMNKTVVLLTPTPSVHSNECYHNRIFHTDEVVEILREIAKEKNIKLVDVYKNINEYLETNHLKIDDIIYGDGCVNDGLHPSDFMQKMIFKQVIEELKI